MLGQFSLQHRKRRATHGAQDKLLGLKVSDAVQAAGRNARRVDGKANASLGACALDGDGAFEIGDETCQGFGGVESLGQNLKHHAASFVG